MNSGSFLSLKNLKCLNNLNDGSLTILMESKAYGEIYQQRLNSKV